MRRFHPDKTKILFFDLEYYVPDRDRGRPTPGGMTFSPLLPDHKILGGVFLVYYPMQDRIGETSAIWEWRCGSENQVLRGIYDLLQSEWRSYAARDQAGSLMLSGIGISHSDIPALLARLAKCSIADHVRVHDLLCGCRQIDLATATYCQFSFNHSYFAYPKTKAELYQKYLNGKKRDSGKAVWEMYESHDFAAIEARCNEEVHDALVIYRSMCDLKRKTDASLKQLKRFEKSRQEKRDSEAS